MSNHAKNQHHVPQFLLRNFVTDKDKIFAYNRKMQRINSIAIKNLGCVRHLYDKGTNDDLDIVLQNHESKIAPIFKMLMKGTCDITECKDDIDEYAKMTILRSAVLLKTIESDLTKLYQNRLHTSNRYQVLQLKEKNIDFGGYKQTIFDYDLNERGLNFNTMIKSLIAINPATESGFLVSNTPYAILDGCNRSIDILYPIGRFHGILFQQYGCKLEFFENNNLVAQVNNSLIDKFNRTAEEYMAYAFIAGEDIFKYEHLLIK